MNQTRGTAWKFGIFAVVMAVLTAFMVMIFSEYRGGDTTRYSAEFADVSSLETGDTVRISGIRVGQVSAVRLTADKTAVVDFDADSTVVLTTGTKAVVRYLNLVGDRYLELVDGPGPTTVLPAGAQIPVERTVPALDLDSLLGGLEPVIQGLDPADVNALTSSLVQVLQGQAGTTESLFARTSTFTTALADNGQLLEDLIENLNVAMGAVARDGTKFSELADGMERLVTGLAAEREPIGAAVDALSSGTSTLLDLLREARPPLAGTVDQLNRLAPALDAKKHRIETALQKAPENYRKLVRIGAYGSFVNYYLCSISIRISDLQNRTAQFPVFTQETGRCAETE
ncbi:mammalian cell entry protein [Mycolicibacterium chitae]|uniref:MCE-family protein n=1 Tax=Mycolicibacterium chitae TaxID=1792 RepID=A0A3S4TQM1_MYCCI|nr:MCE family protein [Mycolicibacterium chitae]MCV7107566.1 MCE family protein [Mycolicibacterium chitae]BBZ01636.1 mammalian cell entry protein [Mycolicibacterium chitae]VEG50472.1 MCE-family protein [Mycolicibacterium chitae]